MSLLSKKIPRSMSSGTCNAGLLATQAGSAGRFIGNLALTLFGQVLGGQLDEKIILFDLLMNGSLLTVSLLGMGYALAIFKRLN